MKVRLEYATNPTAFSQIQVVRAVLEGTSYNLKGAKEYVDENLQIIKESHNGVAIGGILDLKFEDAENNKIIDLLKETYSVTPLSDEDFEPAKPDEEATTTPAVTKPYEVTEGELGVTIHSYDEMTIEWQNKSLFNNKQAERVMAGLKDAHFDVIETPVVYKGDDKDSVMLTFSKRFSSGTKINELRDFSLHVHRFILATCKIIALEEELEAANENVTDAFDELCDYE